MALGSAPLASLVAFASLNIIGYVPAAAALTRRVMDLFVMPSGMAWLRVTLVPAILPAVRPLAVVVCTIWRTLLVLPADSNSIVEESPLKPPTVGGVVSLKVVSVPGKVVDVVDEVDEVVELVELVELVDVVLESA